MSFTYSVPDTELTAILQNRRADIVDQVFKGTAFLNALRTHGMVTVEDGGLEIHQPIRVAKNTAVGAFSGYDTLDTTPQDTLGTLRYPWASDYATISLAWTEEMKNQGKGKLISLLNSKIDDAMMSIKDKLNTQLLATAPGAGSIEPIAFQEIISTTPSTDPSRLDSIGNVSGNTHAFWRNVTTDGSAAALSTAKMATLYNDVSQGMEPPTFLFATQAAFEKYESGLTQFIRYGDSRSGDQGFTSLLFKNIPMFWDTNFSPANPVIYAMNSKYLKLVLMKGADFITTEFVTPDNQAARTAKILWMGNLVATSRRRHGVYHNFTV